MEGVRGRPPSPIKIYCSIAAHTSATVRLSTHVGHRGLPRGWMEDHGAKHVGSDRLPIQTNAVGRARLCSEGARHKYVKTTV